MTGLCTFCSLKKISDVDYGPYSRLGSQSDMAGT